MNRTIPHSESQPGTTMPGQGNAGIARLDPLRAEQQRSTAGEELRPDAGKQPAPGAGPHIAADVKRSEQGHTKPDRVVERNPVDEAAWESFPASDPPSTNPGTSAPAAE